MPVIDDAAADPHDPFGVFRTARLPRWALVRQTMDATQVEDVAGGGRGCPGARPWR